MAIKPVETKVMLSSVVAVVAVEALATLLAGKTGLPMVALGTIRLLETVLILLIVSFWGQGTSSMGLARHQIFGGLKKGAIWSALFGLLVGVVTIALFAAHISPIPFIKTALPKDMQALVWFFVVGGLVAPVAEEVFFRGIVYGFLRRWGIVVALAGTTVFFVAAHAMGSGVPITQIVGGIVFALAYETGGSLMVPVTIHVLGNTAIFALSMVLP
jgi:membrane protease YdiL (CAAX protease family)